MSYAQYRGSYGKYTNYRSRSYSGGPAKYRRKVYTKKQLLYNKKSTGKAYRTVPYRSGSKTSFNQHPFYALNQFLKMAIHKAGAQRKRFGKWTKS